MKWYDELIATGFYSGYFPVASGTAGSLVGALLYIAFVLIAGAQVHYVLLALIILGTWPAMKIAGRVEKAIDEKDPPRVVIDEIFGLWIALLFHPFSWKLLLMGFLLFRLLDILKPFPARALQELHGGFGIMIDDYIAGIYANLIILLVMIAGGQYNLPVLSFLKG